MNLKTKVKQLLGLLKTDPITNREELLQVCGGVAKEQILRDAEMLDRDARIQQVKDEFDQKIEQREAVITHEVKRIAAWAKGNRKQFAGQSLVIGGHELKFQKTPLPGAVEPALGMKPADIIENILNLPTAAQDGVSYTPEELMQLNDNERLVELLIRVKPELDKQAVQREKRLGNPGTCAVLEQVGIRFVMDETFTFTPAREELPSVKETTSAQAA